MMQTTGLIPQRRRLDQLPSSYSVADTLPGGWPDSSRLTVRRVSRSRLASAALLADWPCSTGVILSARRLPTYTLGSARARVTPS
jgi:hypothetical protein